MSLKFFSTLLVLLISCLIPGNFLAAQNRSYYDSDRNNYFDRIRYELSNLNSEIHAFNEKLKNHDNIIESLHNEFQTASQNHRDLVKMHSERAEEKISHLDDSLKALATDLIQFKKHANDSASTLAQYRERIEHQDKIIELQNQNIAHLQTAMQSLMDAFQPKKSVSSEKSYRVKNGDSLEKIARQNKTSIRALKEINSLTDDRIKIGQMLQLPEEKE